MPKPPPAATDLLVDSAVDPEPTESKPDTEGSPRHDAWTSPIARLREETQRQLDQIREWSHVAPPNEHYAALQRQARTELEALEHNLRVLREALKHGPTPEDEEAKRRETEEIRQRLLEKLRRWAGEDQEKRDGKEAAGAAGPGSSPEAPRWVNPQQHLRDHDKK